MKRTRLRHQSSKRRAEQPVRDAVRQATLARAGWKCAAAALVPEIVCGGPLDVDERRSRGVYPGGHLDDTNTQVLCRAHHRWRTDNPQEARNRGLRLTSWDPDDGHDEGDWIDRLMADALRIRYEPADDPVAPSVTMWE